MNRPDPAPRDARRLTRAPLLVCSLAVALCAGGAAVASAQTAPELGTDEPTTTTTSEDTTTVPEPTEQAAQAENGSGSGEGAGGGKNNRAEKPPRLVKENANPEKIIRGRKKAVYTFETGGRVGDIKIQAVKKGNGKVAKSWTKDSVEPGDKQTVTWGAKKAKGKYIFKTGTTDGKALARKHAKGDRKVQVSDGIFPLRGKHQYWDGYGAGRSHDGQDIGASCGTKIVAAQGGKVVYSGSDPGGYGNYAVINVAGEKHGELYAHMKRKPAVKRGENVDTGQRIGMVGDSGNAQGCHTHFEYWRGKWPGGKASPKVTKVLRSWDKAS